MPFDAFPLESALLFSLLSVLASLPTDPYFHPWHVGPPSYNGPYRPSLLVGDGPRLEGRVSTFGREAAEPGFPPYGAPPQDRWHRAGHGGERPRDDRRDFLSPRRSEFEEGAAAFRGRNHEGHEAPRSPGYPGAQYVGNSYSSHVNCEVDSQNRNAAKTPKNIRENIEPIFGSSASGNFDETSRSVRTGNPKEVDVVDPRIVTPKGGRRPPQGNSSKNQNKPFVPGAGIPIPTTEKAYRNQTTTKASKKPRPNNSKPQGGDIVFPDGYPKKFIPRVTKCAKKSTFCEHVGEEYPTEYINQVLKKEGATFREFFGRDVISDPNITERINAPEENSLCPYRQEVVFPRAAQNKEDKWLFIINQDQYVQGVTVEVCLNPESRCSLTEGFPLGYTPYCKQKYIERRLVAIGEDGKPHSDSFRLPSCCSCVVKHESSARTAPLRSSREAPALPRR